MLTVVFSSILRLFCKLTPLSMKLQFSTSLSCINEAKSIIKCDSTFVSFTLHFSTCLLTSCRPLISRFLQVYWSQNIDCWMVLQCWNVQSWWFFRDIDGITLPTPPKDFSTKRTPDRFFGYRKANIRRYCSNPWKLDSEPRAISCSVMFLFLPVP